MLVFLLNPSAAIRKGSARTIRTMAYLESKPQMPASRFSGPVRHGAEVVLEKPVASAPLLEPARHIPPSLLAATSSASSAVPVQGGMAHLSSKYVNIHFAFRTCLPLFRATRSSTPLREMRILERVGACRTFALGTRPTPPGSTGTFFRSCLERICPTCSYSRRKRWISARKRELLPVKYLHAIFVLPSPLEPLSLQNRGLLAKVIISAAAKSILAITEDDLGARPALVAFFDSASNTLMSHTHVHFLGTAGGLRRNRKWSGYNTGELPSVSVVAGMFRAQVFEALLDAQQHGGLILEGGLGGLQAAGCLRDLLLSIPGDAWAPEMISAGDGPEPILKYFARSFSPFLFGETYLLAGDRITFQAKPGDTTSGGTVTLNSVEFIRRSLLHVLPRGFCRTRCFGFLAGPHRNSNLTFARSCFGLPPLPHLPKRKRRHSEWRHAG
jgi:Putative transposase/Transposase zinc-binding domain